MSAGEPLPVADLEPVVVPLSEPDEYDDVVDDGSGRVSKPRPAATKMLPFLAVHPWGETGDEFKARMKSGNTWELFLIERATYRFRGLPPLISGIMAEQHFPPSEVPASTMRTSAVIEGVGLGGSTGCNAKTVRARMLAQIGADGFARDEDFEGRTCSTAKALDWVAENMSVGATKFDAPSKFAWSVFEWCRQHSANRRRFYEMYLPAQIPKSREADVVDDPLAGISGEGEDIGIPESSEVSGSLPGNPGRSEDEHGVASDDDLAGWQRPGVSEAGPEEVLV